MKLNLAIFAVNILTTHRRKRLDRTFLQ